MAVTAVAQASPTPNRVTFLLAQDGGAGTTLTIANATLQAAMARGPLRNVFNASYATQALMRAAIGAGNTSIEINKRTGAAAGGATEDGDWAADVDVDAVTATKPEINITAGILACDAWMVLRHAHSIVR